MQSPSREINTTQTLPHPGLRYYCRRYRETCYRQPIRGYSRHAFERLEKIVNRIRLPLIIDAGCGTGESTLRLAELHPDCLVIGADKSAARLQRHQLTHDIAQRGNYVFIRTNLVDFWRLLRQAGWPIACHYLLYPNPWPKPGQVKRRWHAHPVITDLLVLAEYLEMRCNWSVYAEEFALVASLLSGRTIRPETYLADPPLSPFERKYQRSGHTLFRCRVMAANYL